MNAKQFEKIVQELAGIIDEGIHIVSADGKSIVYNQAMATLEKMEREDVIGKPFRLVFSHIPKEQSTLRRALKYGEPTLNKTQTYLNRYGKEISTVNTTIPILDDNEKVIAAVELSKDITDIKKLSNTILELQAETIPRHKVTEPKIRKYSFKDLIGENKRLKQTLSIACKASKTDASVFIYGETGTGKELIAQSIHFNSARKEKPFLAQNCAALPESLLEGILFGTTKGGFTGAVDRPGLFEQATGGTLLLDEISAMPYELQSKLLRVLQEDYIRRVGGNKDIPIDVRIIATVNETPEELMQNGCLRKDLFYRLNIINISIPPLRERKDDIPILVDYFLEKHNARFEKEVWMTSEGALRKLENYDYPGNVRELENFIMSAVSLADKEHVLTEDLLQLPNSRSLGIGKSEYDYEDMTIDEYLERTEISIIKETMAEMGGNISKAADALGLKRQTLQHKLKKYKI
ncbi:sigma-54 interaction domain-containing protein [Clostridium aminobutyricum]|uniref:Sigma 54-interacting transcriptional regulator n=1 Tax=Clostridium aminobutyricum TaxID=33953 RepID=A0A939IJ78_CLOAM|nr:sigma 54-interacting transcriptional regulator [Clostridium aminobutyricum]MBN7773294.1 sigma 54-interacting transcriptional regulator [Clostridium aminobutyricum]